MSAQLEQGAAALNPIFARHNRFHANLDLASGTSVSISAPTLFDLSTVVGKLQPTEAVNDPMANKPAGDVVGNAPKARATAPAGKPAPQTAEASAPAAAAPAAGEAGNVAAAASTPQASPAASTVSSSEDAASPAVTFEVLKKAFLALSTKTGGRGLCEGVLKPFSLAKLSDAKPEQYGAVLAEIAKAAG